MQVDQKFLILMLERISNSWFAVGYKAWHVANGSEISDSKVWNTGRDQ